LLQCINQIGEKINKNTSKYNNIAVNKACDHKNGHKRDQNFPFQGFLKWHKIGGFGVKPCHLATLLITKAMILTNCSL
jgi:hypothetical protein